MKIQCNLSDLKIGQKGRVLRIEGTKWHTGIYQTTCLAVLSKEYPRYPSDYIYDLPLIQKAKVLPII